MTVDDGGGVPLLHRVDCRGCRCSVSFFLYFFLAAGVPVIILNLSGEIDDRIAARILGALTIVICLSGLILERSRKPR